MNELDDTDEGAPERETLEVKRLRNEVEALKRSFGAKLVAEGEEAIKRERELKIAELESERRRIAVSSEPAHERARKFEAATRAEMEAIERFRDADVRRQRAQPVQQNLPAEVKEWSKRNSWYLALKKAGSPIADEAEAIHVALNAQGVPLKDNLEEVTRRMAAQYPHLAEGTAPRKKPTKRQRSWHDIPVADRTMATQNLIRKGLYGPNETEAQDRYAQAYWREYGDL